MVWNVLNTNRIYLLTKFYQIVVLCVFSTQLIYAQKITVIDQGTLQPVENALLSNSDRSFVATTNYEGEVEALDFKGQSIITVSHPAYETHITTANQLAINKYQIALRPRIILIDEVVISANKWEQNKNQTPNRIETIGPSDIEFNNPQTTADMLGTTNQVFIQKSQLGGGSPMIRGFAANSVLIVVDGVRINNAIFRSGNLQNVISIDPLTLSNTEVLFGPGSVMYGSDALGGVMHFRTKSPGFISDKSLKIGASSLLRYSSANNERTGHVDLSVRGNKVTQFFSFTFSDYSHLKTGNKRSSKFPDFGKRFEYVDRINNVDRIINNTNINKQVFSGYHQLNLLSKTKFRAGKSTDISYILNYSTTSDIPRYDRLIETDANGQLKAGDWFYGPQKWLSNSIQVSLYKENKFFDEARLIMTLQNIKESRNDRAFGDDKLRVRAEKLNVFSLNFDFEKNLDSKNLLFYGMEWFLNDVNSSAVKKDLITGLETPTISRYPDGGSDYMGIAGYISHKWKPSDKLSLTTGLRYNQVWLNALYTDVNSPGSSFDKFEVNNGAINGSVGVAWLPASTWQINGLFSSGFRAPNVDDIGKVFDGANGIVTVPNTNLKPEYSYNSELGITKSIQDKFKISGTAFFTFLNNAMVHDSFTYRGEDSIYFDGEYSKVYALVNTRNAHIYGGNIQLELAITPALGFSSSITVTKGEDSQGRPLATHHSQFWIPGINLPQETVPKQYKL